MCLEDGAQKVGGGLMVWKAKQRGTVPLKSKLPVALHFAHYTNRVARDAIRVAQDSMKRQFWNKLRTIIL